MRRSQRVRLQVELVLTSAASNHPSLRCTTLVVNAHGCGATCAYDIEEGIQVTLTLPASGRSATGRILNCSRNGKHFVLGVGLDEPGNFWGLADPPFDWPRNSIYPAADPAQPQTAAPRFTLADEVSISADLPELAEDNFHAALEQARARVAALQGESTQSQSDLGALQKLREELEQQVAANAASVREETQRLQQIVASIAVQNQQLGRLKEESRAAANQLQQGLELMLTRRQDETLLLPPGESDRQRQSVAELEKRLTASTSALEARIQQRFESLSAELRQSSERGASQRDLLEKTWRTGLADLQQLQSDIQDLVAAEAEKLAAIAKNASAPKLDEAELQRLVAQAVAKSSSERQHQADDLLRSKGELERVVSELGRVESDKLLNLAGELATGLQADQKAQVDQAVNEAKDKLREFIAANYAETVTAASEESRQARAQLERAVREFSEAESVKLCTLATQLAQDLRSEQQTRLAQAIADSAEKFRASIAVEQRDTLAAAQKDVQRLAASESDKLHAAAHELVSRAKSEVEAHLDRFSAEAMTKLMSQVAVHQSEMLLRTRQELQQSLADLTSRAETSLGALRQTTESAQVENRRGEDLLAAMREQQRQSQTGLERNAQQFETACQEIVSVSTAAARARVAAALDPLLESLERRAGQFQSELGAMLAEINSRALGLRQSTAAAHADLEQQAKQSLAQQVEESLTRFRKESDAAAEACILRWQNALAESLHSLPELLRSRAQVKVEPSLENNSKE